MTRDQFRKLALSLEGAIESSHMGHPDFRAFGKIFATLSPESQNWGMVKLSPEDQRRFIELRPEVFRPSSGAWGRSGCTNIELALAETEIVQAAVEAAYDQIAKVPPKNTRKKEKTRSTPASGPPDRRLSKTLAARVARVRKIVESLPEGSCQPIGDGHFSLEVRGRRFGYLLQDHHGDGRLALNLKAAPGAAAKLTNLPDQFHIPKFVGNRGWIGLYLDLARVDWTELTTAIAEAFRLVAPKSLLDK